VEEISQSLDCFCLLCPVLGVGLIQVSNGAHGVAWFRLVSRDLLRVTSGRTIVQELLGASSGVEDTRDLSALHLGKVKGGYTRDAVNQLFTVTGRVT